MIALATWLVAVAVAAYAALVAVYAVVLLVMVAALVLGFPIALIVVACDAWRAKRARRRVSAPRPGPEVLARLLARRPYTPPRAPLH